MSTDNPPIVVTKHEVTRLDGKKITVNVVRDDLLFGGTKQRAFVEFVKTIPQKTLIYAGPKTGFAIVALAYAAQQNNATAHLFIGDHSAPTLPKILTLTADDKTLQHQNLSPQMHLALKCGAVIHWSNCSLADSQALADEFHKSTPDTFIVPFGADTPEIAAILKQQLIDACAGDLTPPRMWVAVGSGMLIRVLMDIYPTTTFMPVRVGKNIWEDQFTPEQYRRLGGKSNVDMLRAVYDNKLQQGKRKYQRFDEPTDTLPPWPSVPTYDAKIYQRLLEFGNDGDYVWNVASNSM